LVCHQGLHHRHPQRAIWRCSIGMDRTRAADPSPSVPPSGHRTGLPDHSVLCIWSAFFLL
jgi:hypothetical protein